jgi:hypothetical protein
MNLPFQERRMMKRNSGRQVFAFALIVASSIAAGAQKSESAKQVELPPSTPVMTPADVAAKVPAPRPEDVKSVDAIINAAYEAISGPAGTRDWNRFRSIFLPQARFTEVGKGEDGGTIIISWGVEDFIRDAGAIFAKDAFYENGMVNEAAGYGNMRQVLSSYESRHAAGEKPFQRGINSFQVLNDGKRWWIVSIFWDSERPDNPLPEKFVKKQ